MLHTTWHEFYAPRERSWLEVGWIFRNGTACVIERRGSQERVREVAF